MVGVEFLLRMRAPAVNLNEKSPVGHWGIASVKLLAAHAPVPLSVCSISIGSMANTMLKMV